jgi:predicted transposase/invertase (TIGR01784 family)
MINVERPQAQIKDLQLVFIELPKFKAKNLRDKKLHVLWLRFMSELGEKTQHIPSEWLDIPEIKEATDLAEEAAYTPSELEAYDKYWDAISIEKTLVNDARKEGIAEGREEGKAEGIEETTKKFVFRLLEKNMSVDDINELTGLTIEKINELRQQFIGN